MQLNLRVSPRLVGIVLGILFVALSLAGGLAMWVAGEAGPGAVRELTRALHIDREGNLPALIQSMTLLTCGVLLGLVAAAARQTRQVGARRWAILSAIFVYLAIDEGAGIHELSGLLVDRFIEPQGIFRFSWVVVAILALTIFAIAFTRFTFRLPPDTRRRFIIAGLIYVGGAVGIEMLAGLYIDATRAWRSPIYYGLTTLEEALEAAGMTLMLVAVLSHLRDHVELRTLKFAWLGGKSAGVRVSAASEPPTVVT